MVLLRFGDNGTKNTVFLQKCLKITLIGWFLCKCWESHKFFNLSFWNGDPIWLGKENINHFYFIYIYIYFVIVYAIINFILDVEIKILYKDSIHQGKHQS